MASVSAQNGGQLLRAPLLRVDVLTVLFALAIVVSLAAKLTNGWDLPFWFDEVYTATIAGQPDVAGLLHWCLLEMTGPAFYVPMWLWAKVAGTGDAVMRFPALAASFACAALIAWRGHPDRDVRLLWAIFTLLWLPVLPMATEARAYPQLLLLGSAQAALFLGLNRSPDLRTAFAYTTVTALFVLTNYYALVITGFQGLALLWANRRAMLRLYPALVPLLIAGVWMSVHLPFVLKAASTRGSQFQPLPPDAVLAIPWFLFGQGFHAVLILVLLAYTRRLWWSLDTRPSPEAQLVWTGVLTFALITGVGFVQATMMPRYLVPGIPALLFGLAWWAKQVWGRQSAAVFAMLAIFFVSMGATILFGSADDRFRDRRNFQFETASAWLMQQPVDRLYFLNSAPAAEPSLEAQLGGFFFERAGRPVKVIPGAYGSAMTRAVAEDRRAGVLLVVDRRAPRAFTNWILSQEPRWTCRKFAQTAFGIVACKPKLPRSPQAR